MAVVWRQGGPFPAAPVGWRFSKRIEPVLGRLHTQMKSKDLVFENVANFSNSKFCLVKGKYNTGRLNLKAIATTVVLLVDIVF